MNYSKESNEKKRKQHKSKNKKVKNRIGILFMRIIFIAILIGGFAALGSGLGVVLGIINTSPDISAVTVMPEGYTTFIYDQNGNEVAQLHGADANRIYAEIDMIPLDLQHAFVAIEDERFYDHFGIDLKGILRAAFVNIKNHSLSEGASTLTQQLIKNNMLTSEKKWERKIREQYLAVRLEQQMDKDKILELYLNTIGLGRGTRGVQAAANRYFYKDVSELTLAESAVIAAITQNPSYYDPITYPEHNKERQKRVLDKMLEQGYISQEEYTTASEEDVYSKIQTVSQKYQEESHNSYFIDEVIDRVIEDLQVQKGMTYSQALTTVYRGGLSIYITQDLKMQEILDEKFQDDSLFPPKNLDYEIEVVYKLSVEHADGQIEHFPPQETSVKTVEEADAFVQTTKESLLKPDDKIIGEDVMKIPQPQAAMVIMDYHNGYVKALVGGRGEKFASQTFNRATQAKRQPGSTFKTLAAYAPALDTAGYTPATVIDDVPIQTEIPGTKRPWPNNWYDTRSRQYNYWGLSNVRRGITWSMNVLAVKTIMDIGVQTSFDYLKNFGFTTLVDNEVRNGKTYSDKGPSLALGGLTDGVTPLELTAAYGAIANKGTYTEPIFYTKVLDHENNILLEKTPITHTVLKETTAFLLTDMMEDVVTQGTGGKARFSNTMPIAGKTGTTSNDKDLVFAGYTPYYVSAIWLGHDQPREIGYNNTSYHNMLWAAVMKEIHKDLPVKQFEKPDGIVQVQICRDSGKLAVEGLCDQDPRGSRVYTEYFVKGTEPTEPCDVHVKQRIDTSTGLLATPYCPEDLVKEVVRIKRPIPYIYDPADGDVRIEDAPYEITPNTDGEYCTEHGPEIFDSINESLDGILPFNPFQGPDSDSDEEDTSESSINEKPSSVDDFYLPQ